MEAQGTIESGYVRVEVNQRQIANQRQFEKETVELQEYLCPLCRLADESASHLFFHCSKVSPLLWEAVSWVNLVGAFPYHPRQHFIQHIHGVYEGLQANRW